MNGNTGWDSLMLSVRFTPDGGWDVQVGAGFVVALVLLACVLFSVFLEDDEPKTAA